MHDVFTKLFSRPITFTLWYTHLLVTDIDECSHDTDGCENDCSNTIGSFYCSCNTGYALMANNKNCIGESLFIRTPIV